MANRLVNFNFFAAKKTRNLDGEWAGDKICGYPNPVLELQQFSLWHLHQIGYFVGGGQVLHRLRAH